LAAAIKTKLKQNKKAEGWTFHPSHARKEHNYLQKAA
jgi:hypothetical protein